VRKRIASNFAVYGFGLGVLAVLAMMLGGFGSRLEWWHYRSGFTILKWSAYLALAATLISLAGLIAAAVRKNRWSLLWGIAGMIIGLSAAWVPWSWLQMARSVPPIHDITTDTENPPLFSAVLPLRKKASNPTDYGGPGLAAQQRSGYPNLAPALLPEAPDVAFERALKAAREMGWQIVGINRDEMQIEAVDTTFWFGFKDDIVVRVTPAKEGSRIDVRSLSRVGKSDVGTNARRIVKFLKRL
jgi:uncharacterized protein (DUF1499 family)